MNLQELQLKTLTLRRQINDKQKEKLGIKRIIQSNRAKEKNTGVSSFTKIEINRMYNSVRLLQSEIDALKEDLALTKSLV